MEGILLGAALVAVLVGVGVLVEAARPRQGWTRRKTISLSNGG
jgi:hypothetical protein